MRNNHQCSELITVQITDPRGRHKIIAGLLDEICESSAVVLLEKPVPEGSRATLLCENCESRCVFRGAVSASRYSAKLGWFVEVEFAPDCSWSPSLYKPSHLLGVAELMELYGSCEDQGGECCGESCRRIQACQQLAPDLALSSTVRQVGFQVARLSAGMDKPAAAACFSKLFHIEPRCRLFDEFFAAYCREQHQHRLPARNPLHSGLDKIARLLVSIPKEVATGFPSHASCGP